jgi:hypothetical protein
MADDMCANSCIAYTRPFADHTEWFYCHLLRRQIVVTENTDSEHVEVIQPDWQFQTIPIGLAFQALYCLSESAIKMNYCLQHTAELLAKAAQEPGGLPPVYCNYIDGSKYHAHVKSNANREKKIQDNVSIDGAQLIKKRMSDCIWVIFNLVPEECLQKMYIIPGGYLPGPKNPMNTDSFLFPGLQHINALMKDGLGVWNAAHPEHGIYSADPFLAFNTAGQMDLSKVNSLAGAHGHRGCCF